MKSPPLINIQPPSSNHGSNVELNCSSQQQREVRIQVNSREKTQTTTRTTSLDDKFNLSNPKQQGPDQGAALAREDNIKISNGSHESDVACKSSANFEAGNESDAEDDEGREGAGQRDDPSQFHVQMLRAKFIALINYNKFRIVYLLSLFYIMLNALLIGCFLHKTNITRQDDRALGKGLRTTGEIILDPHQIPSPLNHMKSSRMNGSHMLEVKICHNATSSKVSQVELETNWLTENDTIWFVSLSSMILFSVLQIPLVMIMNKGYFIQLSERKLKLDKQTEDELGAARSQGKKLWVHKLALTISLLTFHLHVQLASIMCLFGGQMAASHDAAWLEMASCRPRLVANLVLAYMTPMILDPGSTLLHLIGLTLQILSICSATASLIWFKLNEPSSREKTTVTTTSQPQIQAQLFLIICLTPLMILFGYWQRNRAKKSICDQIFTDANRLIEAKVSLEAQRQQQETLLLSVLPAYVAEQVKRNMLRQVEQSHSLSEASSNQQQQQQQQQQHYIIQQTSSSVGQLQSVVSVREASGSGQPVTELASVNLKALSRATFATSTLSTATPAGSAQSGINNNGATSGAASADRPSSYLGRRKSSFTEHALGRPKLACKVSRSSSIQASQATILMLSNHQTSGGGGRLSPSHLTPSVYLPSNPTQLTAAATTPSSNHPPASPARRGFNELFIRTYNNVSLLYADIVGFTQLCSKLNASHLVRVLNNLFSQFDHLADQHKIMRIKILGDCYYGVSGIPEFAVLGAKSRISHKNENHAINCVNMGLEMIEYIGCLNRELASNRADHLLSQNNRQISSNSTATAAVDADPSASGKASQIEQIELNMRIGIHTGHIHSGVIGLKKWQFDVWSNDVSIAMHCESSGSSGRVQVTEATIAHLKQAFVFEPSNSGNVDPFLEGQQIRTYFIIERNVNNTAGASASGEAGGKLQRAGSCRRHHRSSSKRSQLLLSRVHLRDNDLDKKIRTATINTIHQTLLSVDCSSATDTTTSTNNTINHDQAHHANLQQQQQRPQLNYHNMTRCKLDFKDPVMRRLYANRPVHGLGLELFKLWFVLAILVPITNWTLGVKTMPSFLSEHPISQSVLVTCSLFLIQITNIIRHPSSYVSTPRASSSCFCLPWSCRGCFRTSRFVRNRKTQTINRNGAGTMLGNWLASIFFYCDINPPGNSSPRTKTSHQKANAISKPCQRFTAGLILFLLVLQCNQVFWNHEPNNDCKTLHEVRPNSSIAQSIRLQQLQVALFLFLLAINSSSSLLGYCLHSALIFLIALLSLLTLPYFKYSDLFALLRGVNIADCSLDCSQFYYYLNSNHNFESSCQVLDWLSSFLVIITLIWSFLWLRQVEFANKADFLWRNQLSVDHEELEYISGINKILLENILPSHVVQYYLNQQQPGQPSPSASSSMKHQINKQASSKKQEGRFKEHQPSSRFEFTRDEKEPLHRMSFTSIRSFNNTLNQELYHESHQGVAVMFASIPHFYEFYDETDVSKQGLGCIALLNEIICEFDKLLLKNKFSRIEKIKTIGSTYMAVAGLRPQHWNASSRNSNASQSTTGATENLSNRNSLDNGTSGAESLGKFLMSQQKQNLLCMVQFATNLMQALNNINKQSFQAFKLRVGLNSGSVIAGVIGAQRPFYDIWGDTVNIASRMESLGHVGRIQVTEIAANLLLDTTGVENSYRVIKRGNIQVKGKGSMVTYFVDKRDKPTLNSAQATSTRDELG